MIWCADSATGHSAVRSGNATSTEIIGVTDPIKVSWKEEKETGQSCRGHLEVILLLLLEKFAGQYPVYQNLFFLRNYFEEACGKIRNCNSVLDASNCLGMLECPFFLEVRRSDF